MQYNGKAKRQSLETVYLRYMKAGANLTDMLSAMNGGGVGAGEGDTLPDKPPGVQILYALTINYFVFISIF